MRVCSLVTILALFASSARAADWPQWRGPHRDGVSRETGLLKSWPKQGPKLLWIFRNAGLGFSSVSIVGDRLYTLGTRGDDEIVLALDLKDGGKELWAASIGPVFTFKGNVWGDGPRGTPAIDGDRLYALGGQGDLVCLNLADKGKEVWRKSLTKDFDGEMMSEWGFSESPLVDRELLLCTPGGAKGTVVALSKKDGNLAWRSTEVKNKAPYSSIVAADIHGVRQYIQLSYIDDTTGGLASSFAAKDGKVLWSMPIFKGHSYAVSSTPVVQGNQVYVTSGSGGGCHLFEIDKSQKAKDLYLGKYKKNQKIMKNNHGGVVVIDDHVYGHSEGLGWICQERKSGELKWDERNKFNCTSGAITAADGLLYLYTDGGVVALVEPSPDAFKEISSFTIPEMSKAPQARPTSRQSKIWSHPVVANGRLYLRDTELIFCYEVKAK